MIKVTYCNDIKDSNKLAECVKNIHLIVQYITPFTIWLSSPELIFHYPPPSTPILISLSPSPPSSTQNFSLPPSQKIYKILPQTQTLTIFAYKIYLNGGKMFFKTYLAIYQGKKNKNLSKNAKKPTWRLRRSEKKKWVDKNCEKPTWWPTWGEKKNI